MFGSLKIEIVAAYHAFFPARKLHLTPHSSFTMQRSSVQSFGTRGTYSQLKGLSSGEQLFVACHGDGWYMWPCPRTVWTQAMLVTNDEMAKCILYQLISPVWSSSFIYAPSYITQVNVANARSSLSNLYKHCWVLL